MPLRLNSLLPQLIARGRGKGRFRLRPIDVGGNCLLTLDQLRQLLQKLRQVLNALVELVVAYIVLPFPLAHLPLTSYLSLSWQNELQKQLFVLLNLFQEIIPDLLVIGLILIITVGVLRGINAWFSSLEQGKVHMPGFYPEWAKSTARLLSFVVIVLGMVMAYPYLPGSSSRPFQYMSIFVGGMALLGSSGVASNVVSGLMLTYTRAFQVGDRVSIDGQLGTVLSCDLMVSRLLTSCNEVVSLPDSSVVNGPVVNYSLMRREQQQPVALEVKVHVALEVPWRLVRDCLVDAALVAPGVCKDPKPEVRQVALERSCLTYEIIVGVKTVEAYGLTRSNLLASIQDAFLAAGIDLVTPESMSIQRGRQVTG